MNTIKDVEKYESDDHEDVICAFRMQGHFPQQIIEEFQSFYPDFDPNPHKNDMGTVLMVNLTTNSDYSWIEEFILRNRICLSQCNFYMGVLSEYEERTYEVPDYMTNLIRRIYAPIIFSFTVV